MVRLLTEHIDIWTAAETQKANGGRGRGQNSNVQSLYGIKKLRELILELAVRGKLVPQDPNDEPASFLLERIAKKKARLIKEGKIKKQKQHVVANKEEKPFKLPDTWEWVRFIDVLDFTGGSQPAKSKFSHVKHEGYVQLIQIRDLGPSPQPVYVPIESVSKFCSSEDIMIGRYGASVGKVFWGKDGAYNVALIKLIDEFAVFEKTFLFILMQSPLGQSYFLGITRSAQDGFSKDDIAPRLLPLPPLTEQRCIVTKVDELMALCDQLEQQQTDSNAAHQTLVDTLLATIICAVNQDEFTEVWRRIAKHFDTLFTTEYSIDQLKQTFLQLAVMGRLVRQDPSEEPASVLLEKIAKEKARLIKEGKIKKQKPLPEISEDEKPFELPEGWEWARPDDFSQKITDGEHFRPQTQDEGVYFLSAKDIRADGVSLDDPLYISEKTAKAALQRCNPEKGDILIVSRGATVGRICTVDIDDVFCLLGSVILIKPLPPMVSDYLKVVMKTPHAFEQLVSASGSTAQPAIYLRDFKKIVFPIAPLHEQHRIVAKVEELMALCETLKTRLKDAQITQVELADAIVEQAVVEVVVGQESDIKGHPLKGYSMGKIKPFIEDVKKMW